jgi:hypothetical protein
MHDLSGQFISSQTPGCPDLAAACLFSGGSASTSSSFKTRASGKKNVNCALLSCVTIAGAPFFGIYVFGISAHKRTKIKNISESIEVNPATIPKRK